MPCLERGSGTDLIAVASARRDVDVAVADMETAVLENEKVKRQTADYCYYVLKNKMLRKFTKKTCNRTETIRQRT